MSNFLQNYNRILTFLVLPIAMLHDMTVRLILILIDTLIHNLLMKLIFLILLSAPHLYLFLIVLLKNCFYHFLKIEHKMICIERRESATNCNAAKVLSNFESKPGLHSHELTLIAIKPLLPPLLQPHNYSIHTFLNPSLLCPK